jgi:hypothetical protein
MSHGSISQKTTLNIILAAVRTWNLTESHTPLGLCFFAEINYKNLTFACLKEFYAYFFLHGHKELLSLRTLIHNPSKTLLVTLAGYKASQSLRLFLIIVGLHFSSNTLSHPPCSLVAPMISNSESGNRQEICLNFADVTSRTCYARFF